MIVIFNNHHAYTINPDKCIIIAIRYISIDLHVIIEICMIPRGGRPARRAPTHASPAAAAAPRHAFPLLLVLL